MRKHIASDLVGNNVGIICEDVVQNRAVILSWMEIGKIRSSQTQSQTENPSLPEVKNYLT